MGRKWGVAPRRCGPAAYADAQGGCGGERAIVQGAYSTSTQRATRLQDGNHHGTRQGECGRTWLRHRFLQIFLIISPAEEEREISGNNAYFQDPLDTQTTKVITRSVMYDSMRAQHRCAAHCIRSAHVALVVAQHERRLDDVCERPKLLVPEHGFKQGEDTLRSGRVGCERRRRSRKKSTKYRLA